jgi:serine/threonine protein kinase
MMPDPPEEPEELPRSQDMPTPMNDPGAHAPPKDVDYELIRLIGRGGYGEVWLVRDQAGNYYACKVVYRESFQQDRPYEREYEGICKFEPVSRTGESQIKILHVGRRDALGYFYYIMELADDANAGRTIHPDQYIPKTLHSELESKKKVSAKECIQIGLSLSEALENLHRHGLIHRDIKPGNIIFVNGVPKLADIGLVTDLDVTISYVGTEGYIPPEGPTSPRADIYGLGKVLYEISTGKDRLQYPELPDDFAEIPDWELLLELNAIITKACEANPGRRYASAKKLQADLALLASGKSIRRQRSIKRNWLVAGRIILVMAVMGLLAGGYVYFSKHPVHFSQSPQAGPPAKLPAPDAARLAECESTIRGAYQNQFMNGTAAARQQASAELYNQSLNETDPATELAELNLAAQLVMEASDFSRAMEICDRMNERFQINISPVKADLLSQAGAYAHTPKNNADLAEACTVAGFQAIAADDYPSAKKIVALAQSAAQQSGDAHLAWQVGFLADETARCASEFERVRPFAVTLHEKPNDAAANLAMGKFLCFIKNDWATGLPMMALGNDEALKRVVHEEINSPPQDSQGQIALGNSWWDLAAPVPDDEKVFYQKRARYWYLKGIANSKEPEKNSLRQSLADRLNAVPTQLAEVHIFSRVGGTEFIDIYSDKIEWRSSQRGAIGNKINQVNVGNFDAGDLQIIENSEATRLMPDTVDFSSARLKNDRKPGRHLKHAKLTIFADHVRIILSHQEAGSAAIDVTVTFGSQPS